jgi:hypothetical protein
MNQASGHVQAESQKPQDHKRYKNCPKHLHSSFLILGNSAARRYELLSRIAHREIGGEAAPQVDVSNSDQHLFAI